MFWVKRASEDNSQYFKRIRKPDIPSINSKDSAPDDEPVDPSDKITMREGTIESLDRENYIDPSY
jgi:hypothetical protein